MKELGIVTGLCICLVFGCGDDDVSPEGRNAGECSDGADNDGDGAFDCADSDCAASPACTASDAGRDAGPREGRNPGECADGADNDGDGDFDCADDDCMGAPVCSTDAGTDAFVDAGGPGDDAATDATTDATTDAPTDAPIESDAGPRSVVGDDVYMGTCSDPGCGGNELETACACVPRPSDDNALNRVGCGQLDSGGGGPHNFDDDFCDELAADGAPSLGCTMPGMFRPAATPETVTLYGVVDVFGNGGDGDNISVEVCLEGGDGMPVDCLPMATALTADPCSETEIQYENDLPAGERELGFWSVANVPTETPLIIHTSGDPRFWRDVYAYNVVVPNEELERGAAPPGACSTLSTLTAPRWEFRAGIMSDSDWTSLPLTAGLVEGIRPASGLVAGEVHDCGDVRLEFAQVGLTPRPEVFTYFNDNPDNPLPTVGRTEGTSRLGLYAGLDVAAGRVDVAAVGNVGGELVTLGWYRARAFAGAVTMVTLHGLRSHQVPQD